MKKLTKKEQKTREDRVSRIYGQVCNGVQVSVFALSGIMKVGLASIEAGDDDAVLGDKIKAHVETIRFPAENARSTIPKPDLEDDDVWPCND